MSFNRIAIKGSKSVIKILILIYIDYCVHEQIFTPIRRFYRLHKQQLLPILFHRYLYPQTTKELCHHSLCFV